MGRTAIVDLEQNQKIEDWVYGGRSTAWIYESLVIEGYSGTKRTIETRISEAKTRLRAQIVREEREKNPDFSVALCVYVNAWELLTKEERNLPEILALQAIQLEDEPEPLPKRLELPPLVIP